MGRRGFLRLGAAGLLLAALPGCGQAEGPLLLAARSDAQGHRCVGFGLDGRERFATRVPQRCHAIVPHPQLPLVAFIARRPGTHVYLLDSRNGAVLQTLEARPDRHFYGHGLFDAAGHTLYLSENDTSSPGRGLLGVYRLQGGAQPRLLRQGEIATHGIEPHQFAWLPGETALVVANGGMRTEAGSRQALDDRVDSSLVLLARDGRLLSHERLDEPRTSIRHLAVARDGSVVTAQQYVPGAGLELAEQPPLLAIRRPGGTLQPLPLDAAQCQAMERYCASVAVHSGLGWLAVTSPRGNRLQVWSLTGQPLLDEPLADCAGLVAVRDGFIASSGLAGCRHLRASGGGVVVERLPLPAGGWDNHLALA